MMPRSKRNATKTVGYAANEFIEPDSDSQSKKTKKKNKLAQKSDDNKRKKLKIQPQPFVSSYQTPQAESRVIFILKCLKDQDPLLFLEMEVKVEEKYTADLDVYRDWFPPGTEFETNDSVPKPKNWKGSRVIYFQDLQKRARDNYYWDSQQIIRDIHKLFGQALLRCTSLNSFSYLALIWAQAKPKIKPVLEGYDKIVASDLEQLFKGEVDKKLEVNKWPILPDKKDIRSYKEISDYEPNPNIPPFIDQITDKLSTNKKPVKCDKNCVCFDLEKMGYFSYAQIAWESMCPNRRNRVECLEHEGTNYRCHNQAIQHKEYMKIGIDCADVEETMCWGIDSYTRKNIYQCQRKSIEEKDRQDFISNKLMLAIHRKCEDVRDHTDMRLALEYIVAESRKSDTYSMVDRKIAKGLLRVLKYDSLFEGFRIHTKGFGLVCTNKLGIKNNSLIIPYLGEVYQPWRWYEKQDFIKKQMKDANQKDLLPDFYNIMLDMHKDDEKGVDFLFVDPINKGNYSSRLSHSCNPNCGTVTTISNGRYVIGMYAMRDIKYGEELTFDYCSFTESKAEQLQAICLCGQERCKIYYLQLSNSKEYNGVLEKEHCFLVRNAILLKACTEAQTNFQELFLKYRIRDSILKGCPQWLINWVGYILKFIDEEKILYKQDLDVKYTLSQEVAQWNEFTVNQNAEDRIQNLVFTLDKIKYFLFKSDSTEPPLMRLGDQCLIQELWKDYNSHSGQENSIINELFQFMHKQNLKKCSELILQTYALKKKFSPSEQMLLTRMMFLGLSHLLLQSEYQFHSEAMSVILYFMAFTYTYFRPYEYQGFQSPPIDELEWRKVGAFKRKFKSEGRTYSSQFAWGQLIGWFKQTVVAPQASLSQDRRGTLSYPSLTSFEKAGDKAYPFQPSKLEQSRIFFMEHLLHKPSYMWPPELASWSYKNTYKLYGTVLYESFYSENLGPDFLEQVITKHTSSMDDKVSLMAKYEELKWGHRNVEKHFEAFKSLIGENKLNIRETMVKPVRKSKRQIHQYFSNGGKREQFYERLRQEGRSDEADFFQRYSSILAVEVQKQMH